MTASVAGANVAFFALIRACPQIPRTDSTGELFAGWLSGAVIAPTVSMPSFF